MRIHVILAALCLAFVTPSCNLPVSAVVTGHDVVAEYSSKSGLALEVIIDDATAQD